MFVYGRTIQMLQQAKDASLVDLEFMNQTLLLQGRGQREVFFVSDGMRHSIPTWDVFLALNFKAEHIINNVPLELLHALPQGVDVEVV